MFLHHAAAAESASAAPTTTRPATAPGADLRVGSLRIGRVLFLGNSITLHGPAAGIGWTGNWGMAATAQEKDYVHLLLAHLTETAGGRPEAKVRNIADFERGYATFDVKAGLKEELAFNAQTVVIAIGENVPALSMEESRTQYANAFAELLAAINANGQPAIFVRGTFWSDPVKDKIMRDACGPAGAVFVDIKGLGADPANSARAERKIDHDGVAGHPGDKGMRAIADAIWAALQTRAKADGAAATKP